MARPKGTPKTGGRQKGTPNKVTASVKGWISCLIDKNRKQFEKDLKAVEPLERLQMLEKLMPYVVPKQQAIKAAVSFENMTDEELTALVGELTKEIKEDGTEATGTEEANKD